MLFILLTFVSLYSTYGVVKDVVDEYRNGVPLTLGGDDVGGDE